MLKESELKKIQKKINYQFKNTKLLQQAFTRKSYSSSFGGPDNEVLEFFGDRILDYAVTKDLYDRFGKINNKKGFSSSKSVGELCKIDVELVRNSNLAAQITRMEFTKYMQVFNQREKYNQKNKADIFEAILGAVALDSDWDIAAILNAYHSMTISYDKAENLLEELKDDYIETFETLVWKHQISKTENKITNISENYICNFSIIINGHSCWINGNGKSENEAISSAYEIGTKIIYLIIEKKFITDESYGEQLNFLHKYGFTPEPEFHFEYYPNTKDDEELWRCYGTFPKSENEFITEDFDMADAKEQTCYALLCEILGLDFDQNVEDETIQDCAPADSEATISGQGLLKHILSMYQNVA